jgi:hypothetical protein
MGLNIPPDVNPMPSSVPPGHREHEFDILQNEVIGGLAGWMGFVAIVTIVFGALECANGAVHFASLAGMIAVGIGVCMILMGIWLWGASRSFKMIVTTEGMDITLLMDALKKLRGVYTMQGIFWAIAIIGILMLLFLALGSSTGPR